MAKKRKAPPPPIHFVASSQVSGVDDHYLFGKATYLPNGSCGPRVQEVFQLIVLLKGSLRLTADEAVYELNPGDAILQTPGQHEFFRFSSSEKSVHTWAQVWAEKLSREDRRLLRGARGVHPAPSSIHVLIEEGLAVQDHTGLHRAMGALSRACLLRFAEQVRTPGGAPPHPALLRAREIAAAQFAELRSANELARRCGISTTQLRALCRREGSESPSRMIWRLKVEHAIQLLRSTGLTVGEIAVDCGYANPFHLSRAVKKHTGQSPRDLRRHEWNRLARN
jgi:AraC-like DNA-binding protein/quercetin dioxygenase-like cupin family protein